MAWSWGLSLLPFDFIYGGPAIFGLVMQMLETWAEEGRSSAHRKENFLFFTGAMMVAILAVVAALVLIPVHVRCAICLGHGWDAGRREIETSWRRINFV